MTDDQMQAIRDDIAFMKGLAQEGRRAPLLGGAIMATAGAIFGAASMAHWTIASGLLQVAPVAYAVVWFGAMAAFLIALPILTRRTCRQPGAGAPGNRASNAAWSAAGLAIFALGVSTVVASWRLDTQLVGVLFPSIILALYGLGWSVSAAMTGKRWLQVVAAGAFAAAPALAWLAGQPVQYLAYAAALLLLMCVPGLVLMRGEPSEVV